MRKEYNGHQELFSSFSASLATGDTAVLGAGYWGEGGVERLAQIEGLLRRGVIVRTPGNPSLDSALVGDRDAVQELLGCAVALDGRVWSSAAQTVPTKKHLELLETKVHRLVAEEGLGVVAACRKVHCRPSAYYIYRAKEKQRSYGR